MEINRTIPQNTKSAYLHELYIEHTFCFKHSRRTPGWGGRAGVRAGLVWAGRAPQLPPEELDTSHPSAALLLSLWSHE